MWRPEIKTTTKQTWEQYFPWTMHVHFLHRSSICLSLIYHRMNVFSVTVYNVLYFHDQIGIFSIFWKCFYRPLWCFTDYDRPSLFLFYPKIWSIKCLRSKRLKKWPKRWISSYHIYPLYWLTDWQTSQNATKAGNNYVHNITCTQHKMRLDILIKPLLICSFIKAMFITVWWDGNPLHQQKMLIMHENNWGWVKSGFFSRHWFWMLPLNSSFG